MGRAAAIVGYLNTEQCQSTSKMSYLNMSWQPVKSVSYRDPRDPAMVTTRLRAVVSRTVSTQAEVLHRHVCAYPSLWLPLQRVMGGRDNTCIRCEQVNYLLILMADEGRSSKAKDYKGI